MSERAGNNHKDARPNHLKVIGHFILSGKNGHLSVMLKDYSWIKITTCTKRELLSVNNLWTFESRDEAKEIIRAYKDRCKAQKDNIGNGTKRRSQHRPRFNGSNGY